MAEFGGRARFVSEDYGNSEVARRFGVTRYPALFVNDVLVAKPKDFGFYGRGEGAGDGRYTPFKSAESHARLQDDLRRVLRLALAGEAVPGATAGELAATATEPEALPEFELRDLAGARVERAELAGKVVVVEFWATWCPPCRTTLRFLDELRAEFGERVVVLAAAVESDESDVRALAADLPRLRFGFATPEVARRFGDVNALPTLHLFGPDGRRLLSRYGAAPTAHAEVEAAVRAALAAR
ncbi:MAG: TlpA family protein disulfide reductase [Planctomycetes bacterium]|nr:TlpA family protein disulfide reductase [Planctomycetota bacterium]